MVAQAIRTVDFGANIGGQGKFSSHSAVGIQPADKFSTKITPLPGAGEREAPGLVLNADLLGCYSRNGGQSP